MGERRARGSRWNPRMEADPRMGCRSSDLPRESCSMRTKTVPCQSAERPCELRFCRIPPLDTLRTRPVWRIGGSAPHEADHLHLTAADLRMGCRSSDLPRGSCSMRTKTVPLSERGASVRASLLPHLSSRYASNQTCPADRRIRTPQGRPSAFHRCRSSYGVQIL